MDEWTDGWMDGKREQKRTDRWGGWMKDEWKVEFHKKWKREPKSENASQNVKMQAETWKHEPKHDNASRNTKTRAVSSLARLLLDAKIILLRTFTSLVVWHYITLFWSQSHSHLLITFGEIKSYDKAGVVVCETLDNVIFWFPGWFILLNININVENWCSLESSWKAL